FCAELDSLLELCSECTPNWVSLNGHQSTNRNGAPLKLSRVVATGAAAALVAGSTLLVGGTAAAADFWVEADDFGVEGTSYPEGWFIGDGTLGTISSGVSGLTMDGT